MCGKIFGYLTIISANHIIKREGKAQKHNKYWLCRCKCGVEKYIAGRRLNSGKTKSCGCLADEIKRKKDLDAVMNIPGKLRAYRSWYSMLERCYNPESDSYKNYGGRGIAVCERWKNSFESFFEDMGERPITRTLGRKNNYGNYETDNCRWETNRQQHINRRNTSYVEYNGRDILLENLGKNVGIPRNILYGRIFQMGWTVQKAISTPVKHYNKKLDEYNTTIHYTDYNEKI